MWNLKKVYLVPTIFLIQLQLINLFFLCVNSLTNEKGASDKKSVTMHSRIITFFCLLRLLVRSLFAVLFTTFL